MINLLQMFLPPPPTVWMLSQEERRDILISVCSVIVENFVDISTFDSSQVGEGAEKPKQNKQQDKVLAYAKKVLSFGLLYKELVDAVREGDGLRVVRWWRYMLLIFKSTGRKNYCIEAFIMLAQLQYLLSPREKQQLLYSRFINMHGLPGKNISCDLYMEHLNRLLKDAIRALGANKTPNAIDRLGKWIAPLGDILDNFDTLHQLTSQGADHKVPSADKDMTRIVNELCGAGVFRNVPGRKHNSFKTFNNNPILALNKKDVNKWMKVQWIKLLAGLL